ncbi:MAG: uncharacterized protein JWP87_3001 [Labilithrix sp.]|nr:uncharacterized protein [Labilithrix sp.]
MTSSVLAALLAATPTPDARADEGAKKTCVTQHIEGQRLRDDGKLRAARQQFLACSVESCPAPLRKDCLQWLDETDAAMPTVLVRARRPDGQDTADVTVLVDGESVTTRLTGLPVAVDPGEHVLRFVSSDGGTHEERVLLNVGEKNRRITIDLPANAAEPPPPAPPPGNHRSTFPTSAYVVGGVGVVALGSFAFFGVRALTRGNDLKGSCAPTCSGDDASSVRRDALVADISLAVGIVALGAAAWILLTHHDARDVASLARF